MATIILLRHGRTSANASGVLAGWSPGVHLDDVGRRQADDAARAIADACTPDRIITSPLVRCQETARAVALATGTAPDDAVIDDAVGECHYGAWTGRPLAELSLDPLWSSVQETPSQVRFPASTEFRSESMAEMQVRAVAAVRAHAARLDEDRGTDAREPVAVVVSHGDVVKAVLSDALGQRLDDFQRIVVNPASMSVVRYTSARPYVLATNVSPSLLGDVVPRSRPATDDATPGGATGADTCGPARRA